MDNLGIDQNANAFEVEEPEETRARPETPPPNGFGVEGDGFAFRRPQIMKPPRTPPHGAGKSLKYEAHLVAPFDPELDEGRKFRIEFFLDNGTVGVHEYPLRNSGRREGTWHKRSKVINPETGEAYVASAFHIGAEITIKAHRFFLDGADEYTLKFMEDGGDWPMCDIAAVMLTLREQLRHNSRQMRKMFRKFDLDKSQTISLSEFRNMVLSYRLPLRDAEIVTVFRAFDKDRTGFMSYHQFMDAFAEHEDGDPDVLDTLVFEAQEDDEAYAAQADAAELKSQEDVYVQRLLYQVAQQVIRTHKITALHEKFRSVDVNKDHMVDREEFANAFGELGMNFPRHDIQYLLDHFYDGSKDSINYNEFMRVIYENADKVMRL
jgi:Ca2+-binding EF-hand superfamily protein